MVKFARDAKLGQKILGCCVSVGCSHYGISSGGTIWKKNSSLVTREKNEVLGPVCI